jgi:FkbM family methyltransferase
VTRFHYSRLSNIPVCIEVWKTFLESRRTTTYVFSAEDRRLHLCERLWKLARLENRGSEDGCLRLAVEGREFYWPERFSSADLTWLFAEVYYPRRVNPSSYEHPRISLSEAGWILDAGAGEGFFSIYALEKGASSVIAVEPLPQLKPSLEKTLGQYATRERFRVVSAGLGDAGGFSFLKEDSPRSCETHLAEHPAGSGRKVPVVTVDSLADQHGLAGNGFVKMDIEGAEMAALEGAMRTLARHRPKLAVAVYHGYENAQRCKEIILKGNAGYTVEFRGMYGWLHPPRPYMLFAW